MQQTHQKSFYIILTILFLLPLIFVPGGSLSLDITKSVFLAIGVVVATLIFLYESWIEGKIVVPWNYTMIVILLLPVVYLLSALLSTPSSLALFGYVFEIGTFGYMILAVVFLLLISLTFTDSTRILKALAVFLGSFTLLALFAVVKVLTNGSPVWGIFNGNTATPIGRWTDLATAFGLLSVFSILTLGMIPMKKQLRMFLYLIFVITILFLAILNFSPAYYFTLGASIVLMIYFSTIEKHFFNTSESLSQPSSHFVSRPIFLPIVLCIVSLLFLFNPSIGSNGKLGEVVSNKFHISNTEVRPSFSATLSVSRAALSRGVFLGSGPNTFGHDWLVHKPVDVNTTPFWSTIFAFGIGFIPTQLAATGVVGIAIWLFFIFSLVWLGIKALRKIPESRALRYSIVSTFLALIYLWVASFFYAPSLVILTLAFIFSGLFLAATSQAEIIRMRSIVFSQDATTNFLSTLVMVIVALGSLTIGYSAVRKTFAAVYFQKAVTIANTDSSALEKIESLLNRSVDAAPADTQYVALSRIYFAEAQKASNDTKNTPEKNLTAFREDISKSISAARQAVTINPAGYQNWIALGMVYGSLVPKPISADGAYENAKSAYAEASKRNPSSPEVPLLLAQLEISHNNIPEAKSLIEKALALKEDYVDAYLLRAQLAIQENNVNAAIVSAEKIAMLVPGNPAIYFELGLLKYTASDFNGAGQAFSLALAVAPDYANAKYYLGLSLARLGRLNDAKPIFESLLATNQGNAELEAIVKNLQAGKSPF